jgi:MBG domain (YGX type)
LLPVSPSTTVATLRPGTSVGTSDLVIDLTPGNLISGSVDLDNFGKAHLTVTADGKTRLYGEANPAFTSTINGYVNGENAIRDNTFCFSSFGYFTMSSSSPLLAKPEV